MQKKEKTQKPNGSFTHTKRLVFIALMIALSIVLGKFVALNFTDMIRVSLENLPIIFCAIILGPVRGAIVALVADLLGCVLRGYAINPIVTIGAVLLALICGLVYKVMKNSPQLPRLVASVFSAHIVASVIIKTIGLASFYLSNYNMGISSLFLIRLAIYALTGVVEILIISLLLKSKQVNKLIKNIQGA